MDKLCASCKGRCCYGEVRVYTADAIADDAALVHRVRGQRVMLTDMNSKCIALKDGRCSIYEKRPWECQQFPVDGYCCRRFQSAQILRHECDTCVISCMAFNRGLR